MSDWTWEYNPDAQHVVGGLAEEQRAVVEDVASNDGRALARALGALPAVH